MHPNELTAVQLERRAQQDNSYTDCQSDGTGLCGDRRRRNHAASRRRLEAGVNGSRHDDHGKK
jgi:hypothetical protein